ncbi:hypothetical protein ACFWGD_10150 [Corynebacterium sp. NPDC060344]|uniref:hypothetical protein n=1 Tax=Corynebacterium sp. NPDC060344 TaxID=3347101 RepID=UPI00365AC42F
MKTSTSQRPTAFERPRLWGWGATVIAFLLGYVFWIVSKEWWLPSLIIFGLLFVAICGFNVYLAIKTKAFDLIVAAALSLLAPAIVIFVAFGFFFSGPLS